MSWPGMKKFGDKDILTKMSWDILRPCPGHVLCPVLCPQFFRLDQAISTKGKLGQKLLSSNSSMDSWNSSFIYQYIEQTKMHEDIIILVYFK